MQPLPDERQRVRLVQRTSSGTVQRVRILNGQARVDPFALTSPEIIDSDPELDSTQAGIRLEVDLSAAYFDPAADDPQPIGDFKEIDLVLDPGGREKERRPHVHRTPNLNDLSPVKIIRRLPLAVALTGFVFRGCYQLVHQDGLTFEFLHQLAKDLQSKQEIALLGAGPKGSQPLVIRDNGTPYRAFLCGETSEGAHGPEYRLVVMLSDQELKKPAAPQP